MDLSDLRIFRCVVEQGGVVNAARALHRVPSNVTTRIRQLEESLGTPLFHRERRRLTLSPAGELLLGYAERLLKLSDEALDVVTGSVPRGLLRLGALESTTASRLAPLLAAYHARHPEVRIELSTGTNDALTAAVLARRLDAAFVAEPPAAEALSHQPLFAETLLLITPPEHRRVRGPADVAGATVIAFPNGCAYRRRLQRWLGDEQLPALRVLELGSYHAIVACVAAGAGIALVPASVLDTLPSPQVRRHPLPASHARVVTPLVWRSGEAGPAVAALQALALELVPRRTARVQLRTAAVTSS